MLIQIKQLTRQPVFWLSTTLLAGGGILLPVSGAAALGQALLLAGLGCVFGWGLTWLAAQRTLSKQLMDLVSRGETGISEGSRALTNALAALAQGNLSARAQVDIQPVMLTGSREFDQVADVFNKFIGQIKESAKEFNTVTDEPNHRIFYVGSDAYLEGRACGEIMGQMLNGQGDVAVIIGSHLLTSQRLRLKGFETSLQEKFSKVRIIRVAETQNKVENCHTLTVEFVKHYPQLAGIYVTEGGCPFAAARALLETGAARRIKLVCHDLVDETMEYVAQGVVSATVGQDPFAQGHDPVVHLFNHLVAGWNPPAERLLTNMDVVTPENYQQFWQAGRGMIESEAVSRRRARPLKPAGRQIRIAVLGRDESHFWDPVHAGVLAAAAELKKYNASVEWLVPEDNKAGPVLKARTTAMADLVAKKYDAIATDVFDGGLIPFINEAVAYGVPVATFNSEPSSLRGMINLMAQSAQQLMDVSNGLAASATASGEATSQIARTIQQVTAGTARQTEGITKTSSSMEQMNRAITGVARGAQEQAVAASKSSQVAARISQAIVRVTQNAQAVTRDSAEAARYSRDGAQAVEQTINGMEVIRGKVGISSKKVEDLGVRSQEIGAIVETIEDIASQTNLLALNAAIEAARAGEQGKGFAVVADEVRKLAERSSAATREIADLIKGIQSTVREAVSAMQESENEVKEGVRRARSSGEALNKILGAAESVFKQAEEAGEAATNVSGAAVELIESVDSVSAVIEENTAATEEMAGHSGELTQVIENIASVSKENGMAVEEVASSIEEVASQVKDVSTTAAAMTEMANNLQRIAVQFRLS